MFWGCLIMIGTGFVLWFNDLARVVFPGITAEIFDALRKHTPTKPCWHSPRSPSGTCTTSTSDPVVSGQSTVDARPMSKQEQDREHPAEV